ncbi:MAG: peptide deformylase [Mycoplasma sp.]|nr:peptide deformylase [Mycoplasma sp.]
MNFKINEIPVDKKILRKELNEVTFPISKENKKIADWMINYIDESQKPGFEDRAGVGIAANQIGVDLKMFYVNIPLDNGTKYIEFLINPKFKAMGAVDAALEGGEGCLSVPENWPNTIGYVNRKFKVIITGYSYLQKKEVTITKVGYPAIVLQHEMDHINGGLFYDKINQKNPWEKKPNITII